MNAPPQIQAQRFDPNRWIYPWVPILPAFLVTPIFFAFEGFEVSWWLGSIACFFCFDNLGVQIGVHKHLAHRSFETAPIVTRALAFLSVFSGQGSPLVWVAIHMGSHHPYYDTEKDLHSPVHGRFFAFLAWYWRCDTTKISFRPAARYLKDPWLAAVHRHHTILLIAYWIVLGAIDIKALVYLGFLPAAFSITLAGFVNAMMHERGTWDYRVFGKYQNFPSASTYNSVWLGALTMGLGLHNNHHEKSSEPYNDVRWFEIDLSRVVIPLLRKNG